MFVDIRRIFIEKIIFLLLIFFIFTISFCNFGFSDSFFKDGDNLSFKGIDRDSGLSNLSVSSIIEDKYGFLWFGTQGGLNSYDGRDMTTIRNNPFESDGLVHNLIQTMYYDKENHEIWIGTYQGVSRFFISENRFQNYGVVKNNISNPVIVAITKDNDGYIWIGTMDGLNKLDPIADTVENYKIPNNVVRDLKVDSTGRLLIGSYDGLLYYEKETNTIKKFDIELPSPYVMVVEEFQKNIITLGLWDGGLASVNLESNEVEIESFDDNRVYSLIKTSDGVRWVGTWGGGLFTIKPSGEVISFSGVEKDEDSLVHPIVYSMYQDSSDILWIGTNGGGVCKVNPRKSNYLKFYYNPEDPDSLSQGKINKIFSDSDNNLWISIYNNGLNRYDPINKKFVKYINDPKDKDSLPDNQVIDVLQMEDRKMLFGTASGLFNYDMDTEKFSQSNILPDDSLIYALEKASESELWIGTYRNGVYHYDKKSGKLEQFNYIDNDNFSISDNLIYDILVDSKDRVWVGTNNGLNLLENGEKNFKIYKKVSGDYKKISSNTIRILFEDSRGRIWIGMVGGGIAVYNEEDDSFKSFTEKEGMASNVVMGILEDDIGRIWAATHNGISIINPDSEEIFNLTEGDGIGGWEFNSAYFSDYDGTLMFGGIHGITGIPEKFSSSTLKKPKLYITDIELYQKSIDENQLFFNDKKLEFGYKDSFLGFKFVTLNFDLPKKINYFYKLEGFDKEWINGENRNYAYYSNLPPGTYELKVFAETVRSIKSEEESVYFTIEKPWFRTWWAHGSYILGILLAILLTFKIREARLINRRNSELAKINEKLKVANNELENISTKDSLTGLFNRRYFDMILNDQFNLAKRSKTNLSLIMLDIDNFKDVNDNFGHLVGDNLLADIAKVISEILPRNTDVVARYGGDEFGIILYDTDKVGALIVANRIKSEIKKIKIRLEFSILEDKNITVSMGLASMIPKPDEKINDIISASDRALYRAKKEGRNRICIND